MASYADIKKRHINSTSSKKEEEEKSSRTTSSSTSRSTTSGASSSAKKAYASILNRHGITYDNVDDNYINTFISDAKSFFDSAEKDYKTVGYKNASSVYNARNKALEDLDSRYNSIRAWAYKNDDRLDDASRKTVWELLDNYKKGSVESMRPFSAAKSAYSRFKTEDEYNQYISAQKRQAEQLKMDTEAGQIEVDDLRDRYDKAKAMYDVFQSKYLGYEDPTVLHQYQRDLRNLQAALGEYETIEDMKKDFAQKAQYLNQAKRLQTAVRMTNDATNAKDFDAYSAKGAAMVNPSFKEASYDFSWAGIKIGGEDVKNKARYTRENYDEFLRQTTGTAMRGSGNQEAMQEAYKINDLFLQMNDDELKIYDYYAAKDDENGTNLADQYYKSIEQELQNRKAYGIAKPIDGVTASLIFAAAAGMDQFATGIENLFKGEEDYITTNATQVASQIVRENLSDDGAKLPDWMGGSSLGQVGYDIVNTSANMLPSILVSTVAGAINPTLGAALGSTTLGASAAGNAYAEMLNLGYDKGQAKSYAALVGISEASLEYALGGISKLGGKLSGNAIKNVINGVDNAIARVAIQLGGNMLSEFTEEALQDILDPLIRNAIFSEENEVKWSDVLYSGILGALTAFVMEGGSTISENVSYYNAGKEVKALDGGVQRLTDLGNTFAADTVAYQLAGRVNENTGAYTIGRLFNEVNATLTEQNQNDIAQDLIRKGVDPDHAVKNAKLIADIVDGAVPTQQQARIIESNNVLAETLTDVLINQNTTVYQRNNAAFSLATEMAQQKQVRNVAQETQAAAGEETTAPEVKSSPEVTEPSQDDYSVSMDGKTVDKRSNTEIRIAEVASIDNGEMTFKLDNGETINAKDVEYASQEEALLYESVANMGVNATVANTLIKAYDPSLGISADVYTRGIAEAYRYGQYNFSLESSSFAKDLTEYQRRTAYRLGQIFTDRQITKREGEIKAEIRKAPKGEKRIGSFDFDSTDKKLNKQQKAGIKMMEHLSKIIGADFYVFESEKNAEGKRVYLDENGVEQAAPNGYFNPNDNSFHIDLNAGNKGQGFMLFTISHELTHFIKKWSPAKFEVLADFLVEKYGTGRVEDLVKKQMEKAKRLGRTLSYDEAFDEMVADSMETMLSSGNVAQDLVELKQRDKKLWEKIKEFFEDLIKDLKAVVNAYKDVSPMSVEGHLVANMTESIAQFEKLFTDAIYSASENYQRAESNSSVSAEVFYDQGVDGVKYSERVTDKNTLAFLNKQETITTYKTMQLVNGKLYPPMAARTNGAYEDYSVLGTWEQATEHPELIKNGKYKLDKGKGQGSIEAAYNPYMHSSNLVLNDQFSGAYTRPNLVTVECEVPVSELTSGYRAQYAKDSVGWHPWHTGTVAGSLRKARGIERQVFLSRWIKPVRIVPDSEVASMYKELLYGTGVAVPDNVVSPSLLKELKKAGVEIKESGRVKGSGIRYSLRDTAVPTRAELEKKSPVKVVDISTPQTKGTFAERRKQILEKAEEVIKKPYLNKDTGVMIFLTEKSYTHAFSNKGELNINAAEHLPEFIENALLTHAEENTHGNDYANGVYTFFAAAKASKILPVKLKVKEIKYDGQRLPSNIRDYFEGNRQEYAETYDTVVLEVQEIEESPDGSVGYTDKDVLQSDPSELSTIKVADLLNLVKGYAEKYIPKIDDGVKTSLRDEDYIDAVNRGDMETAQKMTDRAAMEAGYTIKAYHGTSRADRVGNVFRADRATSGPMAFFTDDRAIAEHYSRDKRDTSLAYDTDYDTYETQFRASTKKGAKYPLDMPVHRAWGYIDISKRNEIRKKAGQLREDWDGDGESFIFDPETNEANGGFQWQLKEARGNVITALEEQWLNGGTLFNQEARFLEVLEMTGIKAELERVGFELSYKDPNYREEKVYDTYLRMTKPFDARKKATEAFIKRFENWADKQPYGKYDRESQSADMWDKNDVSAEEFADRMREDWERGTSHAWTAIPDVMTDYLKHLNYDGIIDAGGKNGGIGHTVYVPFYSEQVKSADPVAYDDNGDVIPLSERFNVEKEDIRYSDRDPDAVRVTEVLKKENAKLKEDVKYLKELLKLQKSVTHGKLLTKSSVEAAAGHLMNITKARGEKAELVKLLNSFYEYIAAGEFLTWDGVVENAQPAVKWLRDHIVEKKQIDEYSAGILRDIRNSRFRLDDLQKKEVAYYYGSYNNFRKQSMGSFIIAENGSAFDTRWQELSEMYPDIFDPEISSNDMPNELMNIVDRLRNTDMGMEYAYDQELVEHDILHQVYDSYWNVSTLRTVADVKQKEINRLKGTHAKRMTELRDYHKEQTAKLKKEYGEKLKRARREYRERSEAKQREIITRYQESKKRGVESRRMTEMRHKIKNVVNELNQLLLKGSKDKHVMIGLQKVVAEALDAVNMDTVGAEQRIAKLKEELLNAKTSEKIQEISRKIDHIQNMGERFKEKMDNLKSAYANIKNSDDPLVANAYDEVIAQRMDHVAEVVGNTSLRDMSLEQLGEVYEMYKMVLTTVRNSNKAFKAKRNETISVLANRTMEEIHKIGGTQKLVLKALQGVKAFSWNNLKPIYALRAIGSDTFTEAFDNVRAGEDTWAVDVNEAKDFFNSISKKYGYKDWDFKKRYSFKSTTGVDFDLSLEQILSLYAYSKREQADKHLEKGGFVFDNAIETHKVIEKNGKKRTSVLKYTVNTATAHNLSKDGLAKIISTLSEDQKKFVDIMQGYLSDVMGAKGNEVSLEMYGVKLFNEMNYFPLKSAKQFMFEQNESAGEVKIKNSSFSKETVVNASNPIILSNFMDVWANHVNDMSMYHAFVLPLEDFNRIFNYKTPTSEKMNTESVKMFMQNAYGTQSVQYIKQLLTDLNGGVRSDPRESTGKKLISRFKKSAVMASWSVVVQQPSAVARALALIDAKYFDFNPKIIQHKKLWNEVKKYAPVAIIKEMGRFDTDMGRSTVDFIKGEATFMEKMDDALSKPAAYADELTWCHIWTAVKRETMRTRKDLQFGSEAFLKAAGERFTEVIVKTQVYDSVLARSANMRSKSVFMNMVTSFLAEPTTSINMVTDALRQGKRGNKKYARKAVGAVYASLILNAALASIVYAMRDDDEDETWWEKYFGSFTTEIIDSFNPLTYLPFVKDIWSIAQGYDVERSDMSLVSDAIGAFQNVVKLAETDTEGMDDEELAAYHEKLRDAILSGVDGIASLLGIPEKNIRRDITAAFNTYKTLTSGLEDNATSMWEEIIESAKNSTPIWGWMKDASKEDKLYDAIINGDTAYRKRIESQYDDQEAVDNAIRKALRNKDQRIKQAAEAYYNGNIAEYTRIAKAVIADGFNQDIVVKAIMTEVNALKPDEDTDTSYKVTGLYKSDALIHAIMSGDQATADLVRRDLIDTMVANGKTEEEATKSLEGSVSKDCREKFMEGNLTESDAIDVLIAYGGKDEEGAEKTVGGWVKDLFKDGEISEDEALDRLTNYCGMSAEDANADIQYAKFKQEHPDVYVDDQWFDAYYAKVADSGIAIDVYMEYRNEVSGITGEGKKARRMAVINSLPISDAQKDALYFAEGWVESTIDEAPWR